MVLSSATQMLQQRAELHPFGAAVSTSGEVQVLGTDPDTATAYLPVLLDKLRRDRAGFRAVAVCSHVRLPDSHAVRVQLEHHEGPTVHFVVPCSSERLEYGEPRRGTPFRQVWT
jgi:hypothetical protein